MTKGFVSSGKIDRTRESVMTGQDDLKEKFLHSKAARLKRQGRARDALPLVREALEIREEAYLYSDLAAVLLATGKTDEAIDAIDRAIELEPENGAYYYERASILKQAGDLIGASEDIARSERIDENYRRIVPIREALASINRVLAAEERLERRLERENVPSPVADIVSSFSSQFAGVRKALEGTSCPVRTCLPFCCYFSDELVRHGVVMGPWKLQEIRKQLAADESDEDDFIRMMPFRGEPHLTELFPPNYILAVKGRHGVYYPARSERALTEAECADRPQGRAYQNLHWIREGSRACAFLKDRRCSIYTTGGDDGLEACRHFLCLTGFVAVVVTCLGSADEALLGTISFSTIRRQTVNILLSLASDVFHGRTEQFILQGQHCLNGKRKGRSGRTDDEVSADALERAAREYEETVAGGVIQVKETVERLLAAEKVLS